MGKTNTILTNFVVYYHVPSRLRKYFHITEAWWRHQMEAFSALLAIFAGNSPVPGEFPSQRPVTRSFDVFFDLRLNKRLSNKREAGDLRRYRAHYDVIVMKTKSVAMTTWITRDPWASFNENKRFKKMITKLVFGNIWFTKHYITFCTSNITYCVKIV